MSPLDEVHGEGRAVESAARGPVAADLAGGGARNVRTAAQRSGVTAITVTVGA